MPRWRSATLSRTRGWKWKWVINCICLPRTKKIIVQSCIINTNDGKWTFCQNTCNLPEITAKIVNCFVARTSTSGSTPWQRGCWPTQWSGRRSYWRGQGHRMLHFFYKNIFHALFPYLDAEDSVLGWTEYNSSTIMDQDRHHVPRGKHFVKKNWMPITLLPCSLNSCTRLAFSPPREPPRLSSWSCKHTSSSTSCSRARWQRRRQSKWNSELHNSLVIPETSGRR